MLRYDVSWGDTAAAAGRLILSWKGEEEEEEEVVEEEEEVGVIVGVEEEVVVTVREGEGEGEGGEGEGEGGLEIGSERVEDEESSSEILTTSVGASSEG